MPVDVLGWIMPFPILEIFFSGVAGLSSVFPMLSKFEQSKLDSKLTENIL